MGRGSGRLGLRPGESALAATLFALFVAGGLGRGFTRSIAYAGFLARYPATNIPYVYIAVGVVLAALMPVYLRLAGRTSVPGMAVGTFGILVVGEVLLLAGRPVLPAVVDLVLPVWFEALSLLLALSLWAVAGHVLDIEQGKRLLGPVGAGVPVGFLVSGLATPLVVGGAGTTALLAFGATALLAAAVLAGVVGRRPGAPAAAASSGPGARPAPLRAVLADAYVRALVGLFVCWTLAFYVADYMFYERSADRYRDEAALASFLGQYSAVMGVLMLVSGVVLAPWVLRRFGARVGAYVMPAALGLGVVPSVVIGAVAGASPAIFWPAYVTKVGHYALDAVDRSVRSVLYQPLRAQVRLRVQALGEGLGAALSTAAAGVLLLVGVQGLGAGVVEAAWLLLAVLVAWLVLAVVAGRLFPARMAAALDSRRLTGTSLVLDMTALRLLRRNLSSGRPGVVVYALDRLTEAADPDLPRLVLRLLDHPEPLVRAEAVTRTAGARDTAVLAALLARLRVEGDPAVVARLCAALAADGGPAEVFAVADVLDRCGPGTDPQVVVAAAAGLLRRTDARPDGVLARLQAWRASGDRGLALSADHALALGRDDASAWRRVVEAVHVPAVRARAVEAVVAAVLAGDPSAVGALVAAVRDEDAAAENTGIIATGGTSVRLGRLARIAGRVRHPAVAEALAAHVTTPGPRSRSLVVTALVRAGWHPAGPDDRSARALQAQVEEESAIALTVLALEAGQSNGPGGLGGGLTTGGLPSLAPAHHGAALAERVWLLRSALAIERVQVLHRIVGLAALRDPSGAVAAALHALPADAPPSDRQRQLLGEVLEGVGERRLLPVVRALADPDTTLGYLAQVRVHDPLSLREATSPLARTRLLDWTRTCLAAAATLGGPAPVALFGRAAAVSSTVERVIVLKGVGLFRQVPDDVLASVAEVLEEVQLGSGERLFARGDGASTMYVVVTGGVHVHDGDRTVSMLGPGEVVGELALLDDAVRSASVTAAEDTLLLGLDRHAFDELLADHPVIAAGVIRILAARLRARTDDVLAADRRR